MVHPLIPSEDPPLTRQTSIHCHLLELSLISLEFSNFLNVLLTLQNIRFLKYIFKWNFVAIPLNEASIKIHKPCYSCRFLTQPLSQHIPSGFFFSSTKPIYLYVFCLSLCLTIEKVSLEYPLSCHLKWIVPLSLPCLKLHFVYLKSFSLSFFPFSLRKSHLTAVCKLSK